MGLIHNQKVPLGIQCVFHEPTFSHHVSLRSDKKLSFFKRILPSLKASIMVDGHERELEFFKHLNKPLIHQRIRNNNENSLSSSCQNKVMDNQSCFNSFT